MKIIHIAVKQLRRAVFPALAALVAPAVALAQPAPAPGGGAPAVPPRTPSATAPAASRPTTAPLGATEKLRGRLIEEVRVVGNRTIPAAVVRNLIRTREGAKFDPATVDEDYQRVYALRKFANIKPKVEPTETGVIVVFEVEEQPQVTAVVFRGNRAVETETLAQAVDIRSGESIDRSRINAARGSIERIYRDRNHPFAHAELDEKALADGTVLFAITEGPSVRVRKIETIGNRSFSEDKLTDQIKTRHWLWFFRPGTYDPEQIEDDVASIRRFYEEHGFFDVRVGRKLAWSADQSEVQVSFVIDEGVRYKIDTVTFRGNASVPEAEIRKQIKLVEGRFWDTDALKRDVRLIVKAYSPLGFIYQPNEQDPAVARNYLQIRPEPVLRREAGTVGLVYEISEGKPYRVDRVRVRGNERVQDKVFLRELRVVPGQLYNAGELQDAVDRMKATRLVSGVTITPIGDAPDSRDLLVEVQETQTAFFLIGAGLTSNAGVLGNISYEQRNFDISNVPDSWDELFSRKAFTGAGQYFRILVEPGTEQTRARITFEEPWIFDQPFSFRTDLYYSTRQREEWDETRAGLTLTLGHRFNNQWSGRATLRGEDVYVHAIEDPFRRAPEVVASKGHTTLTSLGLAVRRDTTDSRLFPTAGSQTDFAYEYVGAMGGDHHFHKFTLGWNYYQTVNEDLLDRRTVLSYRVDAGYIAGDAPFFERFYGGGLGSIRGFRYRGVSPRQGPEDDPIGGEFSLTGSVELNFPVAGEMLRGVVFVDAGTVESEFKLGTIRSAVGVGIRLTLPLFGQVPIALDVAFPITKDDQDDTRYFSFSLGFVQ
ncbi:MAG: outer membrane protein assembly factor [Phycisphaerae bacterium]